MRGGGGQEERARAFSNQIPTHPHFTHPLVAIIGLALPTLTPRLIETRKERERGLLEDRKNEKDWREREGNGEERETDRYRVEIERGEKGREREKHNSEGES